jgi:hypothetical protein
MGSQDSQSEKAAAINVNPHSCIARSNALHKRRPSLG